jgi:hypothetical protein
MKKIFRFAGLLLLGIILVLFLIPIVFKDKIILAAKDALNDQVNSVVDFNNVDLSLFRSFPDARLTISDLSFIGIDTFENVPLFTAESVYLVTDISPLFKKEGKLSVKYVSVSNAQVNIIKLNDSLANYLITKETGDTSGFNLVLQGYEINNSSVSYLDKTMDLDIKVKGLNHDGSGNLSDKVFELKTKTRADSLNIKYAGFTYLNHVKTNADVIIGMDLPNEKYSFTKGVIGLNRLGFTGDGTIDFESEDMIINTSLNSTGQSFENFVTVLPFIENNKEYQAKGTADISIMADGTYNSDKGIFPEFNVDLRVKDGYLKYKVLPYPVSPVNVSLNISSKDDRMNTLSINIPHFDFGINKEKIEGKLLINRASTVPSLEGRIQGGIDLDNWKNALPLTDVEKIAGKITSDLAFKGKLSDIEQKAYEKVNFDGNFVLKNIIYHQKHKPAISLGKVLLDATPQLLSLHSENLQLGKSAFNLNGKIKDPLHVVLKNGQISGSIELKSDILDFDEFNTGPSPSKESATHISGFNPDNYKSSNVDLILNIKKMIFRRKTYENILINGKLGLNVLDIQKMSATVDKSDVSIRGKVTNAYNFFMNNDQLSGNISLTSNYLDLNQFMTTKGKESEKGVLMLPSNVDMQITSDIQRLDYSKHILRNLTGVVSLVNSEAKLENIDTELLGGKIHFDGLYNTSGDKPEYSLKLAMDKIRIEDAYHSFVTMKTLAPVSRYIKGILNTTLIMSGSVTEEMTPDWSDINAEGYIETFHSALQNLTIFDQIADKLGVDALKKIDISSSKNWFSIQEGTVELKEKTFSSFDIGMKISGKHKIKGDMDYDLFLKIPRSKIRHNKIVAEADKGFSWIVNEAAKRGVSVTDGEYIDLKIDILGQLLNPQLKYTILGSSGKNMAEQLSDEIKSQIDKAADSIKNVVIEKKKTLEDTVKSRLEFELEKSKEKLMTEAEKKAQEASGTVKKEVQKELESRVDSVLTATISDSLKKKAEEIMKSKTGEEVKEIKKKIEDFNPFKKKKTTVNGKN